MKKIFFLFVFFCISFSVPAVAIEYNTYTEKEMDNNINDGVGVAENKNDAIKLPAQIIGKFSTNGQGDVDAWKFHADSTDDIFCLISFNKDADTGYKMAGFSFSVVGEGYEMIDSTPLMRNSGTMHRFTVPEKGDYFLFVTHFSDDFGTKIPPSNKYEIRIVQSKKDIEGLYEEASQF